MIIRCERCSTLYELDESLLAPDGSDVQCTRCQHVFRAQPSSAAGKTLTGMPAQLDAAPAESPAHDGAPAPVPAPAQPPLSRAASAAPPETRTAASASHQAPRYTPGPTPYRPPISQPSVSRPPLIRRDTVGTFESRLRWSHRWRWLAPALFAAVVGLGVVAFLLRESLDPRARDAHQSALELAWRDDLTSLEKARSQVDVAVRAAPKLRAAEADRALVDLLIAGALADQSLDAGSARSRKGEALAAQASAALDQIERTGQAPAEVARARAVAAALAGDRAQVKRLATAARNRLADDPFVEVAEQSAEICSGDRAARERAIGVLSLLVSRRPELIRARYLVARGQALSGRRPEALATLEALLKTNPRHEGALALKEGLSRSALPAPSVPSTTPPQPGARTEKPVAMPRKPDSTAGEPAGAATGGTAASAAPPPAPVRPAARAAEEPAPAAATPDVPAAGSDRAPGDPEAPPTAPRLRPAAVPDPEPVQGGG